MASLDKPIIFFGTGRSGTTIISEVFMRHPDVGFPSNYQLYKLNSSAVNVVRNLFDNRFWRIHGQKKQLNKTNLINRALFKPVEGYDMWEFLSGDKVNFTRSFLKDVRAAEDIKLRIRNYFSKMIKYQGRKRLSFKIAGTSRLSYLHSIFPDAHFIQLNRDLIPTISSFVKVKFWQKRGKNDLWWDDIYTQEEKDYAMSLVEWPELLTAFQMRKIKEVTEYEISKCNIDVMRVNYEEFVDNPNKIMQNILKRTNLLDRSEDVQEYLNSIQIFNRNKKDTEYFNREQLDGVYHILNSSIEELIREAKIIKSNN